MKPHKAKQKIKGKSPKTDRKSPKIEGDIDRAAQTNLFKAVELAVYGHERKPIERLVESRLSRRLNAIPCTCADKSKPCRALHAVNDAKAKDAEQNDAELVKLLLEALDRRDGDMLRAIAKQLETFSWPIKPFDAKRYRALMEKSLMTPYAASTTVNDMAKVLEVPYSKAYHLMKKLKFPMAKDTTGAAKHKS